jgi:hypothetical protein
MSMNICRGQFAQVAVGLLGVHATGCRRASGRARFDHHVADDGGVLESAAGTQLPGENRTACHADPEVELAEFTDGVADVGLPPATT